MRRCLTLARRAEGRTAPNPIVGSVIVDPRGRVLAQGWHRKAGEPHAEADALARVRRAPGATLYVSLEPCGHRVERRTQPCAPQIIAAGVARVVYGLADPYPGHGGNAELVAAGVEVVGPVLEAECRRANAPFVTWATERRAHVTLKAAMTLDGRIATKRGESRWVTGEAARAEVHRLRDRVDAVLVGAGTVLADDPALTVRGVRGGRDPARVVLDGRLRISPKAKVFLAGRAIVATSRRAPAARVRAIEATGAEVLRFPGARIAPRALLEALAQRGILSVLVEGGADTHASFLGARLCDRLLLFVAPVAFGGGAPAWLGGAGVARIADAPRFRLDAPPRRLGDDLLVEAVMLE
jgi:diaminohydroxyphosphoribosylaminopyrimidine deaminase/5-amino-6-(5-phosphoribosylamino)uracil reductase